MNTYTRKKAAIFGLILLLFIAACSQPSQSADEVAEAETAVEETEPTAEPTEEPTEAPTDTPEPTNTPEPTDTPIPTDTPEPTDTPTPLPTDTPVPTDTPTPTETPVPTDTPTSTPIPLPTNTPVPPEPTEEPTPDNITLYYISNPNDILGTFPVRPFDKAAMYSNMLNIQNALNAMKGQLDGIRNGDGAACDAYVSTYNNLLFSGVFYDEIPADWEDLAFGYEVSFIFSLDRTRPAYLSCVDSGGVDQFNLDLAFLTIEQTLNFLNPRVNEAAARQ